MGTLIRTCPHCHAVNTLFTSFAQFKNPNTNSVYLTAFYCGNCHGGYLANIEQSTGHTPHQHPGNIDKADSLVILDAHPKPINVEAPEYLPTNLEHFFIQAKKCLNGSNFDASAMMSRKVLEVAVKTLNVEGTGSLYKRIEQLHQSGKITDQLKNWAHIIRDDGNEAVHEEVPVPKEFAAELLSFTELFLMYTFTLPGMVQAKQNLTE